MKCIHFFTNYYGVAPLEILYKLYSLKIKTSIDEMNAMLLDMPMDIVDSCIFPLDYFGMEQWPKNDPLYSEYGVLIHLPLLEENGFVSLLKQQQDKKFHIPSIQLIDEISRIGYEESSIAYKNMQTFFLKKMNLSYEKAVTWCLQIWANSYEGDSPTDVLATMSKSGLEFKREKYLNEFLELLMTAHNHTRLKENRGQKPIELAHKELANGMPTIVPGSSRAAALLRDAEPQLKAMNIPVDLYGNAATVSTLVYPNGLDGSSVKVEKKIYPNDPCPCGSGKKYKKCCGKN